MKELKKLINTLYGRSAKLNLYIENCKYNKDRVLSEIFDIEMLILKIKNRIKYKDEM